MLLRRSVRSSVARTSRLQVPLVASRVPPHFAASSPATLKSPRLFSSTPRRPTAPLTPLSTVSGPLSPPLITDTLGTFWDSQVARYGSSPALICRHETSNQWSFDSPAGHLAGEGEGDCLRWSYSEMGEAVDALARGLLKMGVKKGDRVGVFLGNGSAYATLQWATAKVGAILVCINPASSPAELRGALSLTGSSTLFICPQIRGRALIPILHELLPSLRTTPADQDLQEEGPLSTLKRVVICDSTPLGGQGFGEMLEEYGLGKGRDLRSVFDWEGKGLEGAEECSAHEVVNHQFTSGTTGLPKAVALTHSNVLNNGLYIGQCMDLRPPNPEQGWSGERLCNSPPAFHCFGLVLGNLALWTHGGCVVYPNDIFSPSLALRAVHKEKCTVHHGVPTMFIAQLALLDKLEAGEEVKGISDLGGKLDFSSLRTGIAAGSPVPDDVMKRMVERMNLRDLTITYGMSETSPATCMSITTDPLDLRCHTVGRVMPNTHIRIVSPSHPDYPDPSTPSVPIGEAGELWSGGYAMMKGYWQNQKESDKVLFSAELPAEEQAARKEKGEVLSEGVKVDVEGKEMILAPASLQESIRWIRTGDQATMDERGFVKIVGRIKDIIIRGGENLFPVVIEARMLRLAGVEDCSIVSVPDPIMGETVGAFIARAPNAAGKALDSTKIREHITNLLSHQSAPDWVWYLGEDGVEPSYPVTQSGKIRKVELRDWARDLAERKVGYARPAK